MAYKQKMGNIFHQIQGSQSSANPGQPGIGGFGEVDVPSPAKIAPIIGVAARGALALAGRTAVGQAIKQGGKRLLGKGIKKAVEYVPKTSFGKKAFGVAMNVATGWGLGSMFSSGDSDDSKKDNPSTTTNSSSDGGAKKPGSYVKPGGKATGNMKDYALNSQGRRDEYTARGWKQDNTTSVKGAKPVAVNEIKPSTVTDPVVKNDPIVKPSNDAPSIDPVKAQKAKNTMDRKNRSIDKKQGKIDQAVADGNTKKATRKQRNLDNKKARLSKKGMLDAKYSADLSGGDESDKKVEESAAPFKKMAGVPYTKNISAATQFRKPNASGQYRK